MNILLLTHSVPYPPESGPKVKTYHLLRYLADRHRVTLISFARSTEDLAAVEKLRPLCANVYTVFRPVTTVHRYRSLVRSLISGRAFTVELDDCAELHTLISQVIADATAAGDPFDLVHADQIQMAAYAEPLPIPRLIDQHNAVYQIYERLTEQRHFLRRWLARRESELLRRHESRLCDSFEAVTTVSEEDRQALNEVLPRPRHLSVIPIGVDTSDLQPIRRDPQARAILSLAGPNWPPNVEGIRWFARQVYPLVRRQVPDSRFYICGAHPAPAVRALADRDPSIEVTGFVDPVVYIEHAACLIVPLRQSGGMRVMILEALARGIPIISTSVGIAGLDLHPGEHLLVADTPSDFADAVALLLRDPELGERIAAAGRQRVVERYDWRVSYRAVDMVYERMMIQPSITAESGGEAVRIPVVR